MDKFDQIYLNIINQNNQNIIEEGKKWNALKRKMSNVATWAGEKFAGKQGNNAKKIRKEKMDELWKNGNYDQLMKFLSKGDSGLHKKDANAQFYYGVINFFKDEPDKLNILKKILSQSSNKIKTFREFLITEDVLSKAEQAITDPEQIRKRIQQLQDHKTRKKILTYKQNSKKHEVGQPLDDEYVNRLLREWNRKLRDVTKDASGEGEKKPAEGEKTDVTLSASGSTGGGGGVTLSAAGSTGDGGEVITPGGEETEKKEKPAEGEKTEKTEKPAEGEKTEKPTIKSLITLSEGDEPTKNQRDGFKWIEQAAKNGSADACKLLSKFYQLDDGIPGLIDQNMEKASKYEQKAKELRSKASSEKNTQGGENKGQNKTNNNNDKTNNINDKKKSENKSHEPITFEAAQEKIINAVKNFENEDKEKLAYIYQYLFEK